MCISKFMRNESIQYQQKKLIKYPVLIFYHVPLLYCIVLHLLHKRVDACLCARAETRTSFTVMARDKIIELRSFALQCKELATFHKKILYKLKA